MIKMIIYILAVMMTMILIINMINKMITIVFRTGPGYAGQESEALYQELEPQYQSLDQVRHLHHHRDHH